MRQPGGHGLVYEHRAAWPGLGAGGDKQVGVRPHADHDEHEVDVPTEGLAVRTGSVNVQCRLSPRGGGDGGDGRASMHVHRVFGEFGLDERAECGVDGGENFREYLDLDDLQSAGG